MMERIGQCHCGSLRVIATGETDRVYLCHCKACQRRTGTASIAANLAAKTTLRCEEQLLADMLFALPPDAYYRLVHEEGWPVEAFSGCAGSLPMALRKVGCPARPSFVIVR